MTREFNKQRRDDSRPSWSNQSSNRSGDERSARPARPRLNRETVDRAWESGAQQQHADYRPRSGGNGQAPRTNWRSEHSSSQNGSNGNRPYGNRPDNYRDTSQHSERPFNNSQGSRSNDSGRRNFDDQRAPQRSHYTHRPDSPDHSFREKPRSRGGNTQFSNRESSYQRRGFNRNERPSADFNRGERSFGGFNRNERPSRDFRPRGRSLRDHDEQPRRGPDTQNPRWQSRFWTRPHHASDEQQELPAQFEGDYERFDNQNERARPARSMERPPHHEQRNNYKERSRHHGNESGRFREPLPPSDEAHVTRLPDGRVLKGSRPQQRRNAQFWTEVAEDTEELVGLVHTPQKVEKTANQVTKEEHPEYIAADEEQREKLASNPIPNEQARPPKSNKRVADVATRTRNSATVKTISKSKPRESGPRPSQRGYKWPTP